MSAIVPFFMTEPSSISENRSFNFKQNLTLTIEALKKNNAVKILASKSFLHGAPSYSSAFNYYLIGILGFKHTDFSLRQIGSEIAILLGILSLNSFFRFFSRAKFIKIAALGYIFVSFSLLPLLNLIVSGFQDFGLLLVVAHTSINFFFYEMLFLSIQTLFIEICPPNLETFFMSIVSFLHHFFRAIGLFSGSMTIYFLSISKDNLSNFPIAVFLHWIFVFVGCAIIISSKFPTTEIKLDKSGIIELENNKGSFIGFTGMSTEEDEEERQFWSIHEMPQKTDKNAVTKSNRS